MSDSYKIYASKDYVDEKIAEMPDGFSGSWDDLTDRPFGEELERYAFVENYTHVFDTQGAIASFSGLAQATDTSKDIIVVWDGVEYICAPYYGGSAFMEYIAGAKTIWTDSSAEHEYPFLIIPIGGMYFDVMAATAGEHTFSIYQENNVVSKIHEKYIPDTIAKVSDIPTIPTNVSAFTNDAGYLTEHQDLSTYALKTDIPTTLDILYPATTADAKKILMVQSDGTWSMQALETEEWTFTLEDGSTVVKKVVVLS